MRDLWKTIAWTARNGRTPAPDVLAMTVADFLDFQGGLVAVAMDEQNAMKRAIEEARRA